MRFRVCVAPENIFDDIKQLTPVEAPVEAPVEVPVEAPVDAPVEAATETTPAPTSPATESTPASATPTTETASTTAVHSHENSTILRAKWYIENNRINFNDEMSAWLVKGESGKPRMITLDPEECTCKCNFKNNNCPHVIAVKMREGNSGLISFIFNKKFYKSITFFSKEKNGHYQ